MQREKMAIQAQSYQQNLGFPSIQAQSFSNNEIQSGCGLNFDTQNFNWIQQTQQQRLFMELQKKSILQRKRGLPDQIGQQLMDFDQLLQLQMEKLRVALHEQRRQQTAVLLKRIESKTQLVLNQKDLEMAQAAQRTAQLQSLLQKLEMENQAWRRAAEENEAVVASLNNTLEELSRDRACRSGGADDGASRGGGAGENEEDEAGAAANLNPCKSCNVRGSCVLFLPCRHLCSCKACEAFLGFCPVCRTAKKATVEALIF